MLAFSFFTVVFSSLLWLIFSLRYLQGQLAGLTLSQAGVTSLLAYVLLVGLPLLIIWLIFGYVNQYLHNKSTAGQLQKLFGQMKKNQDYSDLLARVMIETEQQVKDGFMLGRFDLLIGDMNELLSEIIRNAGLASVEQIEHLWIKVQNGGKWSFGKVIIEVANNQPDFQRRLFEKCVSSLLLGGTVMEFCARYQSLVAMLEKHDKEKVFLDIIETGVMGKVFSILAPVADQIRKMRDSEPVFSAPASADLSIKPMSASSGLHRGRQAPPAPEMPRESLLGKIFKKKPAYENEAPQPEEPDRLSLALERSFGSNESEEPRFEISLPEEEPTVEQIAVPPLTPPQPEPEIAPQPEPPAEPEISLTQQKLDSLRREWAEIGAAADSAAPAKETPADEENLAYPFGGWTDEQNYRR